jgi:hypothetical protein
MSHRRSATRADALMLAAKTPRTFSPTTTAAADAADAGAGRAGVKHDVANGGRVSDGFSRSAPRRGQGAGQLRTRDTS